MIADAQTHLVIADDHPLFRDALRQAVASVVSSATISEAGSFDDLTTLRDAIQKVMDGDVWVPPDTDLSSANDPDMTRLRDRLVTLTPQQVRVLMMLSEGLLNKQIAYELGVSEATIKAHVSAILQKLGVESRTQAVIAAAKIAGGQWRQGTPTT